jgi:hypothetical protein
MFDLCWWLDDDGNVWPVPLVSDGWTAQPGDKGHFEILTEEYNYLMQFYCKLQLELTLNGVKYMRR